MLCKTFESKLDAWIDGELDAIAIAEMELHERECERCRCLATETRAVCAMLVDMSLEEPPDDLHDMLMECARAEAARGKPKRKINRWGVAGIAAAAVVVVCVGLPLAAGMLGGGSVDGYTNGAPYMAAGVYDEFDAVEAPASPMYDEPQMAYDSGAMMMAKEEEMAVADDIAYDDGAALRSSAAGAGSSASSGAMEPQSEPLPEPSTSGEAHGLKLIRSGYVTLETRIFDDDLAALNALIAQYGGYIENSSVSGIPYNADPQSYGRWAHLSARIPSASLDAFLSDAKGIGNLVDSSINAYDVTASYQDTELRLSTLRAQHERLTELLAKAEAVEDLVAIESELSRVQYEMDSLTGTLKDWDARVDYSSVSVSLDEVKTYSLSESVDPTLGERIGTGFNKGLHDFIEGAQNVLVFLVTALPVILLIAAVGVGGFFIVRGLLRRRKGKAAKPRADDDPPVFEKQ